MGNTLTPYDPLFYAQAALQQLEKSLGMAGRVHRGFDKNAQQPGSVIQVRTPGTFTAADAPAAASDLKPSYTQVALDHWREVKFALTDKELNTTGEIIIRDHVRPAAVALADDIDQHLCALWKYVPWYTDVTLSSASVTNITDARKQLFNNKCPLDDIHMMVDGELEAKFLGLAAFSQYQGGGDQGVNTQMRGSLGTKFGFGIFSNQNVESATTGTCADTTGAIDSGSTGYLTGATMVHLDAMTSGGTAKIGDTLAITGDTQRYVITADVTFTSGEADVYIYPALAKDVAEDVVVNLYGPAASPTTTTQNLAFHRNAFCLAMAPLTTMPRELGAKVEALVDPITGLAIRSRIFYVGDTSKVYVALDVLYGVKTLNCNMAVRMRAV